MGVSRGSGSLHDRSQSRHRGPHLARVVVADVVGQRTVVERSGAATRIRTETTLSVTTALTGPVGPAQVTLSQPGGVAMVDGAPRRHEVHGAAHFEPGEWVLVFLESARADQLVVSGMALGKFTVAPDAVTGELMAVRAPSAELAANPAPPTPAEPSLEGRSPSDSPALRVFRVDDPDRLPLATLVARIRHAAGFRVITPPATVRP